MCVSTASKQAFKEQVGCSWVGFSWCARCRGPTCSILRVRERNLFKPDFFVTVCVHHDAALPGGARGVCTERKRCIVSSDGAKPGEIKVHAEHSHLVAF